MPIHRTSTSLISLRSCLLILCISMVIIQVCQSLDDNSYSSTEDLSEHQFERRNSRKVAQMLQQILQRGEMQVEPYRIHKFLGRLNRRRTNNDQMTIIPLPNFK